jgi:hypothetical protein
LNLKKNVPNPKLEGFKNWMNWAQTCNQRELSTEVYLGHIILSEIRAEKSANFELVQPTTICNVKSGSTSSHIL